MVEFVASDAHNTDRWSREIDCELRGFSERQLQRARSRGLSQLRAIMIVKVGATYLANEQNNCEDFEEEKFREITKKFSDTRKSFSCNYERRTWPIAKAACFPYAEAGAP